MKKLLLLLLVLGVIAFVFTEDEPTGGPEFQSSYFVAMSQAKKTGKPAVLIFSASWCPPCKTMRKLVYPSDAVKPFHEKFVWAYLDIDDAATESVVQEYGVSSIPHIEFIGPDGKPLMDELVGGEPAEMFAHRLRTALARLPTATAGR